jgi:Rrf2 family cysteine metabolism transcriptional repressor
MKLSTKGRYSVTALYELAQRYEEDGIVPLKDIAASQGLSENYLEQLMATMRKAGLVESTRGAQGGYRLSRSPEEITICDIITAAEGPIALVDCLLDTDGKNAYHCVRENQCVTRGIWEKVCQAIENVLAGITLADLCRKSENASEKSVGCGR